MVSLISSSEWRVREIEKLFWRKMYKKLNTEIEREREREGERERERGRDSLKTSFDS